MGVHVSKPSCSLKILQGVDYNAVKTSKKGCVHDPTLANRNQKP